GVFGLAALDRYRQNVRTHAGNLHTLGLLLHHLAVNLRAVHIAVLYDEPAGRAIRTDIYRDKAPQHTMKSVIHGIHARTAGGMRVRCGSTTEFLFPGWGIDGMVLPMAVAVEEELVVTGVLRDPFPDLVAFLRERVVGVVVVFVAAVRSDHRGRRDDD